MKVHRFTKVDYAVKNYRGRVVYVKYFRYNAALHHKARHGLIDVLLPVPSSASTYAFPGTGTGGVVGHPGQTHHPIHWPH